MSDNPRFAGRTVKIAVRKGVTPDDIQQVLARVFEVSGCTACGFLGFDLHVFGVDPASERLNASERLVVTVGH